MPSFASHDETVLHYDVLTPDAAGAPERPPLVVLAGGPARHPEYLGDLAGLTLLRTLVVLHQRGVGASSPSPTAPAASWPALADDVEALRRHLGLAEIELLGHSAGTRVALAYAARHPHRLASLCLLTPPAQWLVTVPDDSSHIITGHRAEPWYADYVAHRIAATAAKTASDLNHLFPYLAPIAWSRWTAQAREHEATGAWHPAAQDLFFAGADPAGILIGLAQVHCPVLVVAGADDGLTGLAPVLAVADLFTNGRAVTIAGAGHYPWVEQPQAFTAALAGFYRRPANTA
ncbi:MULTISPECIES: alpha/beta fold hydrolase [Cryobacterium]|uniref:alpha/beta fold hydrolase n=1 Tax=Cryobacterium TaxID=69578 RepID=UPI000CD3E864|nr:MULTISPECIES: alpha/beta hydrolase [Cryobacterium]POH63578.1 alpha/beta hydrolase [Cryobacterium zongtaii]TFC42083.1 alpha/beta hydrolase [Cryobacterium sp. TMN-39-2]